MPQQTERTRDTRDNGRRERHYDFTPIDYDIGNIEPDAAPGEYPSHIQEVAVMATSKDKFPMIRVEWRLDETATDSPEAQKSVGAIVNDFIAFFPEGDRRGNFPKRRMRQLLDLIGVSEDLVPTRMESKDDFDRLIDEMKGKEATIWVVEREDRETKERRASVQYTQGRGSLGPMTSVDEEEEEEERRPRRAPERRPSKPQRPSVRRR